MGAAEDIESTPIWLTTGEVAERVGMSKETIRRWLDGPTPMFPNAYQTPGGGHWRIPLSDVRAFLEARRAGA
jgi:hypothetical protein